MVQWLELPKAHFALPGLSQPVAWAMARTCDAKITPKVGENTHVDSMKVNFRSQAVKYMMMISPL